MNYEELWLEGGAVRFVPSESYVSELEQQRDTLLAQAQRLALELECLLLDTKDTVVVSRWWDSGMSALEEFMVVLNDLTKEK